MLGLLLTAAAGPTAPVATDPAAPTFTFKQVADMNNLVGAYPSDGPGTNSSNGVSRFLGRTDTVAECQDLCASLSGCHSYTWCDEGSRGGYGKTCYMRTDNAWCDASSAPCHEADHMSGRKLPVVPTPSPPPAQQCATPKDCSYNGACSGGRCVCSRAWTGPACGQLALMPLEPESSGIYKDPAVRSWGASLWHDPPVLGSAGGSPAGLWHLFANEIKGGCSLYDWDPNSQIVHLTSPTLDAKFTRQAVVLPPFSSNPAVRFDRNTATFLLFYIGTNGSVPGLPTAPHCNTRWPKQPGVPEGDQIYLATAKSLSGPWETSAAPVLSGSRYNGASKSSWDYHRTNPAPVVLPNGTVLLYFRGTPGDAYGERMGLAIADNFSAPFVPLPDAVIDDFNEGEDRPPPAQNTHVDC